MKKLTFMFLIGTAIAVGCKKDDTGSSAQPGTSSTTSSSTTTTTSSTTSGSTTSTTGTNQNFTIDDFVAQYTGVINETTTLSGGGKLSNSANRVFNIEKISDTQVKYSTMEGNFEKGRIVFPYQEVFIGSVSYMAEGTATLKDLYNIELDITLKGSSDSRVQEITGHK